MGLVMTPESHAAFLLEAFRNFASRRQRARILISGAADYGLLAHVLWASGQNNLQAEITVTDVCDTPLHLNRWYSERAGARIETVRADILEYQPAAPFDMVCTHSFIGQFARPDRGRIAAKWRDLLLPGGQVVTANRLSENGDRPKRTFSPEEVRSFREKVLERARELRAELQCDPEDIARKAEEYGRRRGAYPVTFDEVAELFRATGFRVRHLSRRAAEDRHAVGVAGRPSQAEHVCVVAERT